MAKPFPCLLAWVGAIFLGVASPATHAGAHAPRPEEPLAANLADLSLEQLANIEVTSVSRRAERLSDAAASVYVITSEDIRRSGATTLPEALRLAPNLEVARADANQYAISARGFNSVLANKMLVLIDGRTVYSPLFSGVFWEAQDVVLDDVDRIEVISGPGGTLWGTNAVNGVINIITRSAAQTQGLMASGSAGDWHRTGSLRWGGGFGDAARYRLYGKVAKQEASSLETGPRVRDGSDRWLGGARGDWADSSDTWTVMAEAYRAEIDQVPDQRIVSGHHAIARWEHRWPSGATTQLQAYYDRSERDQPGAIRERLDTWDVEFLNGLRLAGRHNLLWGAGYRYQPDRVDNLSPALALIPADRDLEVAHAFVEDGIRLASRLDLILGIKVEHNVYTGFEGLPTVRVAWKPTERQLVWAAGSRAVRAPARVDRDFFSPAQPPHFVIAGGPDFRSEIANVAELGYRAQPWLALSLSATAFLAGYDRLRSIEPSPAGPVFENGIEGNVSGLYVAVAYRPTSYWRLSAGGTTMARDLSLEPGHVNAAAIALLGSDPSQWWIVHSALDIGSRGEIDLMGRRIGALPSRVPAYETLDGRIGWRLLGDLEIAVAGTNLLGPKHPEWGAPGVRTAFGPRIEGQVRWTM